MEPRNKYLLLAGVVSLLFSGLALLGWFLVGEVVFIVALGAMLALLMVMQIESHHRIQKATQFLLQQQKVILQQQKDTDNQVKQVSSLVSIFSALKINQPLPKMGGWAISPDFAKIIVDLIFEKKPKLILEASSGVSTLIASYCLKQLGEGKVISLEEEKHYAEISQNALVEHGLNDIATILQAPLTEIIEVEGKKWRWYDTSKIQGIKSIDMLIIDGPSQHEREEMIRYPALPLLFDSLSDDAIILLDDADRKDEEQIVNLWLKQFPGFELEKIATEKGTAILRKKKAVTT
ncbi:MAG TPA: class I SAM-dependent methyltransferase [Oculatellaceae cyanobacterium]